MTMTATYSPEDNKLRLYASCRLDNATYQRVRKAGFKWAPKQELFVAPMWTPAREDLLLELCGEIGDDDYSPEERAADRAERFSDYRDKRRAEANGFADTFEAGPIAFGHQNLHRAERQAAHHDRFRIHAVSQWSKAEYWQQRTAGVISHALYKSSAPVRRSRLLRLEAEQRKHEADFEEAVNRWKAWQHILTLEGLETPWSGTKAPGWIGIDPKSETPAFVAAYTLANSTRSWMEFEHPTTRESHSMYSLLTDAKDPITPREAAELYLANVSDPTDPDCYLQRWRRHYELRVTYEKAMLEAEGGMAGEADMEPGGWIRPCRRDLAFGHAIVDKQGWAQILKVNKSPATGRVTSVAVLGSDPYLNDNRIRPRTISVERLGENAYRPPTEEERKAFKKAQKEAKAKKPKVAEPKLVNPTEADAERLQAIWNEHAQKVHESSHRYSRYEPSAVFSMTQAEYSSRSKGSYGCCETCLITEKGLIYGKDNVKGREKIFKLRMAHPKGANFTSAMRVVVITDKPQKSIPWKTMEEAKIGKPTEESVFPTLGRLAECFANYELMTSEEGQKLTSDAGYVGWAYSASYTQRGFTEAGREAYQRFLKEQRQPVEAGHLF